MLKDITLGQYYPTNSEIHRLDPRVKILFTFVFMATIFMVNKFYPFVFVILFIGFLAKVSKIPIRYLAKGIKPLWVILLITFSINAMLTPGKVLWSFWIFKMTREGLQLGIFMILRLVLLVIGTSLLTLTTAPIELTDGIEKLLNPLRRIGVPAHEIAMMMTIALRFIPTLLDETDKIMKAQMARGADFESKNLVERAKSLIPLLVPLFISAFRRADELAMAMESRCYRGGEGRTRMNEIILKKSDIVSFAMASTFMLLIAGTRFFDFGI
ncbi:MAG: energy-coupling factor transporter transmembrane component T [Peptostreptococcaceae bacterium]|nr:energy-coupling factor transporter transmembrane component T [Peptostreptococcaceae bacterium]